MAAKDLLHFFDITSTLPGTPHPLLIIPQLTRQTPPIGPSKSWSPNTLRTRLALNYKKIPYTQSFISYPDIAPLLRSLSVPPLRSSIPYTLPAILHPASIPTPASGALNDSLPIALHLDATFPAPEYPALFPTKASYALALAVQKILSQAIQKGATIVIPKIPAILDPRGREYFLRTREQRFGKPLSEVAPKEGPQLEAVWKAMRTELEVLAGMLRGKEEGGMRGPFFEGETVGYADFLVVSFLAWFERADRGDWERLCRIGEGEFGRLWEASRGFLEGQGEERRWDVEGGVAKI